MAGSPMVTSLISSNRDNTGVCVIESSIEQLIDCQEGYGCMYVC